MPHECFADEIAIDFPSVGRVVERMRDRFLGETSQSALHTAEVSVSKFEAGRGRRIPVDVQVRTTCPVCGGRGESWAERCDRCRGTGESLTRHVVRVPIPAGVMDGARLRFRFCPPDAPSMRVEVRVVVRPAAC
jgi:predicted RNA-binding Zn-ribbon protein involved in translation (DUF1610 family)